MRVILSTVGQIVLFVAVASAVALTANGQRGKNSIDLNRTYFTTPKPAAPVPPTPPPTPTNGTEPNAASDPPAVNDGNEGAAETQLRYTVIDLDGVKHAVADTRLITGEIVIVDARSDTPFQAGRIPGAIQFDYYRSEHYIDIVLPRIMAAGQIIVYCNGGACEDSILTCDHFVTLGVPENHLCLFKDGWEAWKNAGLPIETGPGKE